MDLQGFLGNVSIFSTNYVKMLCLTLLKIFKPICLVYFFDILYRDKTKINGNDKKYKDNIKNYK